jgi:hypothetical protein
MIPKTIHYCWFGKNPIPKRMKQWMRSWKKYCPDYAVIEWNEENFDFASSVYAKQAYEAKKWAFVSDYARLYILYHHGGIYMDTDVELLKHIDSFLENKAFLGFEQEKNIQTGIMACEKGHPLFNALLNYYHRRPFIKDDGTFDLTTNVSIITDYCLSLGLAPNNTKQTVADITLYPTDYFCPKDWRSKKLNITANTYAIHHFEGSWVSVSQKIYFAVIEKLIRYFPFLPRIKRKLFPRKK